MSKRVEVSETHIKQIKWTVSIAIVLLSLGWALFFHLDNKIESKTHYLNSRIDNVVTQKAAN